MTLSRFALGSSLCAVVGCSNDYGALDFTAPSRSAVADAGDDGAGGSSGSGGDSSAGAGGSGDGGTDAGGTGAAAGAGGAGGAGATGGAGGTGGTPVVDSGADVAAPEGGADAPAPPSCDDVYGAVTGYVLCSSDSTSCTFEASTLGGNCDDLCTGVGQTCLDANDNGPQVCVATNPDDTCTTNRQNTICTCTR